MEKYEINMMYLDGTVRKLRKCNSITQGELRRLTQYFSENEMPNRELKIGEIKDVILMAEKHLKIGA